MCQASVGSVKTNPKYEMRGAALCIQQAYGWKTHQRRLRLPALHHFDVSLFECPRLRTPLLHVIDCRAALCL